MLLGYIFTALWKEPRAKLKQFSSQPFFMCDHTRTSGRSQQQMARKQDTGEDRAK